nr:hypothetical protein [Tanacetum cinerariifolium]
MVTILEKSNATEGFEQIIDFLSGSYIHYALTVNPHIYVSCIKQFWNTASVKRSDDVTRLQALVDRKKIVISEDVIHEILQLDDVEGVVCLPNEEIFAGLAQMGYEKPSIKLTFYKAFFSSQWKFLINTLLQSLSAKRTSWNEFSLAMASTVIYLSKGQKFNFSKYIFDSLVRNVDSRLKFYMYPRFIQLIIQNQIGDLSTHTTRYISLALTQKVFANMRRVGKGFSGVETPLFEGMLVAREIVEEGIAEEQFNIDAVRQKDTVAKETERITLSVTKIVLIKLESVPLTSRFIGSDFVHLSRWYRRKVSFHQALDLIFELDETAIGCTRDILTQRDCLDWLSEIPWVVPTFVVIDERISMMLLEHQDIIAKFYGPSW